MDIDTVFTRYCEFGRKQKIIVYIIALYTAFLALQQVLNVFVAAIPQQYYCSEDFNGKYLEKTQEHCTSKICSKYKFSDNYTTIVTEWQLVCEDSSKAGAVQSAYMFGVLWSSYFVGEIADRFGRRRILYVSVFALYTLGAVSAFVTSFGVYIIIRHFVGVFSAAFGLVSYVLAVEVCGGSMRGFIAVIMPTAFAIGIVLLSLLAYIQPDWRLLTMYCSAPGIGFVFFYYYVPESPRWLYSQGHLREAQRVLQSFSRYPDTEIKLINYSKTNEGKGSVMELFLHKYMRIWTLVNIYVWCVNCLVYYGLTLGAGNIGGSNIYLGVALSGLIEVPAYLLTYVLLDSYGRRNCMSFSMLLSGICCLLILTTPTHYVYMSMALALIGKMMISMSFSIAFVYVTELYPTNLRNKAMGIANMAARVGGIISPLLVSLGSEYPLFDYTVYAILSLTAGLLARLLPETCGRQMPESLGDIELLASGRHRNIEVMPPSGGITAYEVLDNLEEGCSDSDDATVGTLDADVEIKVQRSCSYKDK